MCVLTITPFTPPCQSKSKVPPAKKGRDPTGTKIQISASLRFNPTETAPL